MEWSTVWVSTKPLITEENWPGQGLNPGLPNDTPALYPLLHELMINFLKILKKVFKLKLAIFLKRNATEWLNFE
jgi:hypothetical protein